MTTYLKVLGSDPESLKKYKAEYIQGWPGSFEPYRQRFFAAYGEGLASFEQNLGVDCSCDIISATIQWK